MWRPLQDVDDSPPTLVFCGVSYSLKDLGEFPEQIYQFLSWKKQP